MFLMQKRYLCDHTPIKILNYGYGYIVLIAITKNYMKI